ncbi:MAG: hypothetical protein ED556_05120 [Winogradskyella sp.]|uniref:hypothetical protein n=1 Tax=Winogradskyella sp. TaxID=1883156 RepID=UPI000F3D3F9D|nr:hypothetical protein [Winogradskyella sp.]RNC86806.1 MAG: hypothetical protein ED556_05120 [Winogradskyella sp.]
MKKLIYLIGLLLITACVDTTDDVIPMITPDGELQDDVEGVILVFPFEDELCNEGTDLTPTESTVFFEWEPNNNAETYTVTVENLTTGDVTQVQTEDFITPITIARATPFRWFVEFTFEDEVQASEAWNFYNAGPGVQTYPPFPAEIVSPLMAQTITTTTTVNLQWNGSDVDNDIVSYEVYFGTENPPAIESSGLISNSLLVSVNADTIYYWYVVTLDAEGNTSESVVHQFRIL